jgi:hypothetical protein
LPVITASNSGSFLTPATLPMPMSADLSLHDDVLFSLLAAVGLSVQGGNE